MCCVSFPGFNCIKGNFASNIICVTVLIYSSRIQFPQNWFNHILTTNWNIIAICESEQETNQFLNDYKMDQSIIMLWLQYSINEPSRIKKKCIMNQEK